MPGQEITQLELDRYWPSMQSVQWESIDEHDLQLLLHFLHSTPCRYSSKLQLKSILILFSMKNLSSKGVVLSS